MGIEDPFTPATGGLLERRQIQYILWDHRYVHLMRRKL